MTILSLINFPWAKLYAFQCQLMKFTKLSLSHTIIYHYVIPKAIIILKLEKLSTKDYTVWTGSLCI